MVHPLCCVSSRLDDTPVATAKRLPGESEEERDSSGRLWRTVIIGDQEQRIDMQVIRPYLRVVTHGGQSKSVCACLYLFLLSGVSLHLLSLFVKWWMSLLSALYGFNVRTWSWENFSGSLKTGSRKRCGAMDMNWLKFVGEPGQKTVLR